MIGWACLLLGVAVAVWGITGLRAWRRGIPAELSAAGYASPTEADAELDALQRTYPERCRIEEIGRSGEGRPIRVLRIGGESMRGRSGRAMLLVTGHIHGVEYVGAHVARAVARRLVEEYGRDQKVTDLLDRAEVVVAPLLNPDAAARIWQRGGWTSIRGARYNARAVDLNRNFPVVPMPSAKGGRAWNSARARPGSLFYAGPHPLSEPECSALAQLCWRERFRAAVNFHSFGCVVYMPQAPSGSAAQRALDVFDGPFQSHQQRRYRAVRERANAIRGQLDPFLLAAFGTASVTVEVSQPPWSLLRPGRFGNMFWVWNPLDPEHWAGNDVDATIQALLAQLDATDAQIISPTNPGLYEAPEARPA
ncbi:MAG: hypothetical protein JRH17_17280 [Deltaproteobacteria bacterium]|nr:hypothetical protein [Deltaproteobacteria bacterium]